MVLVADKPVVVYKPLSGTESSLEIGWSVGNNGGGKVSKYTVTWSTSDTFTEWKNSTILSVPSQTSLTLSPLAKGTRYYTKVEATNCVGSSISEVVSNSTRCCKQLRASWPGLAVNC